MYTIEGVIERLQKLKDGDYTIRWEVYPDLDYFETISGEGIETIKNIYTITLEDNKVMTRKYRNENGIKIYEGEDN